MGTSLTGLTPATTYDALIKVGDNGPITGALKVLSDGLGTNLPMEASTTAINFTGTLTQAGTTLQSTLVSGTNIKTINGTSVLGSGNIAVVTSPSGVAGAIQFSNGSAFASDATNLFWDDTNNRLGVGTNVPTAKVFIQGTEVQTSGTHLQIQGTGTGGFSFADSYATTYYSMYPSGVLAANRTYANYIINSSASGNDTAFNSTSALNLQIGGVNKLGASNNGINIIDRLTVNSGSVDTSARAVIKGSGSTSATTSLLVQNSAGTAALTIKDDLTATLGGNFTIGTGGLTTLTTFGATGYYNILGTNSSAGNYAEIYRPNSTGKFSIENANRDITISNGAGTYSGVDGIVIQATTHNVGIGVAAPLASALLDVTSTTKGFLPPRMTTTQKNAIATPAAGLVVYDSTTNKLCCYNGSSWNDLF